MQTKILILYVLAFTFIACSPKTWQITDSSSTRIALDASTQNMADSNYIAYLKPFKQTVDKEMNVVIGEAAETMRGHAPESLLSNFSADVYRQAASEALRQQIDIAIVNLGGLRTQIPAGTITLRKVFELMPFENELVVVWIKGDKLYDLLQFFAKVGGEGVSGLRMLIDNGKAVDISIGDNPLDVNKLYSIATNDYLAGGNDKMYQLAMYEKRVNTSIKVRNMLLQYIKNETQMGRKIQSKLDGRIR
jgi:2',3'-cyclic-nucleotide 2'-phosphodiesterase (5'-nucleotidase family)